MMGILRKECRSGGSGGRAGESEKRKRDEDRAAGSSGPPPGGAGPVVESRARPQELKGLQFTPTTAERSAMR
ncbi:hypothetical protein HMPREF9440_01474, partial [Sutterella parvirubra YIT 11816]